MSRNYDQMIDDCTGSAYSEETLNLGNGNHITAHHRAEEKRMQNEIVRQLQVGGLNLDLPDEIKGLNGWIPIMQDGSFMVIKDPNGIISLNSKIPQITPEQAQNLVFLTRNQIVDSGIDRYGCKTTTDVAYSDIIDSMTKDRIIRICCEANRLGL